MSDLDADILERFTSRATASSPRALVADSPVGTPVRRSPRTKISQPSSLARRLKDVEGGGGRDTAIEGESPLLDTSIAASVETPTSQGSRLVDQQPFLSSVKGVYSLHYLDQAKNVCGASIGDKTNASFCLKAAGTCTVTNHAGKSTSLWCKSSRLYLKFAKQGKHKVSEVAIEPRVASYELETDDYGVEDEIEILQENNHVALWDADLRTCSTREKAIACFESFAASAVLIKQQNAEDLNEMWTAVDEGNGEPYESDSVEEEDESDEDLSLESEVPVVVVRDTEPGNDALRLLVRNLELLNAKMVNQEAIIVSLKNQIGGIRTEVVEQLDTCIKRDSWADYRRDTYAFVNKKSRLLVGCAELLGTCKKLEDRVEELEMLKNAPTDPVVDKEAGAVEALKEALSRQEDEIYLLKNRLGSDCVKFGSVNLRSLADTYIFVNTEMTEANTSFGCFFDLVALMDSVMDSGTGMSEFLKNSADSRKIDHKSVAEARTCSSFNRTTPTIFTGAGNTALIQAGTVDRLFSAVKKRDCWTSVGGSQGIKRVLEREIQISSSTILSAIDMEFKNGKAGSVAKEFLEQSKRCFQEFVNWSESFFLEIVALSEVTEEEAWILVLECWGAFFEALRRVRAVATNNLSLHAMTEKSARTKRTALFIYTMGRAIQVQNEFVEANFKRHPTIATVINYHLFSNRTPTSKFVKHEDKFDSFVSGFNVWKAGVVRDLKVVMKK